MTQWLVVEKIANTKEWLMIIMIYNIQLEKVKDNKYLEVWIKSSSKELNKRKGLSWDVAKRIKKL